MYQHRVEFSTPLPESLKARDETTSKGILEAFLRNIMRERCEMERQNKAKLPTIHVISDSMGITARTLTRAATSQFGNPDPKIELLPNVQSFEQARKFLEDQRVTHMRLYGDDRILLFYTLVESELKEELKAYIAKNPNIVAVDLISDAVHAISEVSGCEPTYGPGGTHVTDAHYFHRISALEFTIAHDDGQRPQDLPQADIVILGVSRTSKTPTSIYLGQQGYRVANVPLVPGVQLPEEIYQVNRSRIFGLMTSPDVLVGIRRTRMGSLTGSSDRYASFEKVREELDHARMIMRGLGCLVINTEDRAIEETAQEIIRRYDAIFSSSTEYM